jgi:hypothetical protein
MKIAPIKDIIIFYRVRKKFILCFRYFLEICLTGYQVVAAPMMTTVIIT